MHRIMILGKDDGNIQSSAGALRAGDIIPPYGNKDDQERNSQVLKGGGKNTSLPSSDHEIPRFDLAEEILAEQRKIVAVRRKSPSPKNESIHKLGRERKVESTCYAFEQPIYVLSEQQQIIEDIVVRDIENLIK